LLMSCRVSDLLVMAVLAKAKEGKIRYTDLYKDLYVKSNISSATLTNSLKRLQLKGFVRRIIEENGHSPAVYYKLTDKGMEVFREEGRKLVEILVDGLRVCGVRLEEEKVVIRRNN